jgi:hypothetical protein
VALALALRRLTDKGLLRESPLRHAVAAVSVGICRWAAVPRSSV